MHRFFLIDRPLVENELVDLAEIAHQLRMVLRLRPEDQILLLNGQGQMYRTRLVTLDQAGAVGQVLGCEPVLSEPSCFLTLFQCALKADKFEWVLQKGTEIGVSHFVPVISSRTIVRPADKIRRKYDRWQSIIREAAEQAGRGRLPSLGEPLTWQEAILSGRGLRLLPWEESDVQTGAGLDTMVQPGDEASLLIGPEGGLSPAEVAQAVALGWQVLTLGPRILRAETAALVATTLVLHYADRS